MDGFDGGDIGSIDSVDISGSSFDTDRIDVGADVSIGLGDFSAEGDVFDISGDVDIGVDSLLDTGSGIELDTTDTDMPFLEADVIDLDMSDGVDEGISESLLDIGEDSLEAVETDISLLETEDIDSMDEASTTSILDDLHNPALFLDNPKGEYTYSQNENGKTARGSLELSDEGIRNAKAQLAAGGEFREETDDGGHLIGTRFNGSPDLENIDAQNRSVNRGNYKSVENEWARNLDGDNSVFVNIDTYKSNQSDRPNAYMGYSITEDVNENRKLDTFSFQNQSNNEQKEWEDIVVEADIENPYPEQLNDTKKSQTNAVNDIGIYNEIGDWHE